MNSLRRIGVVGGGREAAALAAFAAPSPRFRIARWAPAAEGAEGARAASYADRLGVPLAGDWSAVVADPALAVVLVSTDEPVRRRIVLEALGAGKGVLCAGAVGPAPAAAEDGPGAVHSGGGFLLAPGELRYTSGARATLETLARGDAGRLHSVYIAARTPIAGRARGGVVAALGWDVADFLVAAVPDAVTRIQARGGRLFGDGEAGAGHAADTVVALIRFSSDVIASIELAECLPPALPAEVEIEIVGTRLAIHLEPYRTAVRVYGAVDRTGGAPDDPIALHPWVDPPVLAMLNEALDVADGARPRPDGLVAMSRTMEVVKGLEAVLPVRHAGS